MILFDIETNGLLDAMTKIHCIATHDTETGERNFWSGEDVDAGVAYLNGKHVGGHNAIKFDVPAIQKLHPEFTPASVYDTLVVSRLIYSNMSVIDVGLLKAGKITGKLFGSHSLKAWGYRLGVLKGDYSESTDWAEYTIEMGEYCRQDVEVTLALYNKLSSKEYSTTAITLEHEVAELMGKQERNGFPFNEDKAIELLSKLTSRKMELEAILIDTFGSWQVRLPDFIPKRDNKTLGYKAGVPVKRSKTIAFNPQSREHIADRLMALYGWQPEVMTETGKPKVDEDILSSLNYPPCADLCEYLLVSKRMSQLSEGNQAWLKVVREGKIHGSVNSNGAVTGRATHAYPNLAQVPSAGAPFGKECRELFGVPTGWVQAGSDASGLELRCLAHFMGKWDKGEYGKVILEGDIHTANQQAAGLPTRNNAKTFIYAFLYGAGDAKIGKIVGGSKKEGKSLKAKFLKATPAIANLTTAVKASAAKGYLKGLDGRKLHIRSEHSALNTLLQSAGALICKKWIVQTEKRMLALGYKHGWEGDFAFMAWVHDEIQVACRTQQVAEDFAKCSQAAMKDAEEFFEFRCPLDTDTKIGSNWYETH